MDTIWIMLEKSLHPNSIQIFSKTEWRTLWICWYRLISEVKRLQLCLRMVRVLFPMPRIILPMPWFKGIVKIEQSGILIVKHVSGSNAKFYIPSTLNIDLILWHTQLIVCAVNVKSWFKSWVISFTFQTYTMPHALNFIFVSLFKFHIWILKQF